ncbi:GNAT family N-acetyltransferase [Gloeocapsa sp. PCC 73106]|uniref:GNAT family N-acetyltransferase n=1 Tax=Gloeocapsa sp. PCC 73106 TaxID=102232 RepID=UPI0002AC4349|nr:GNAT family N-acetyltransferase [Gloeocapsa sp. PCC 73106]ELR97874.1 sortase-like acyltransferase [Gloeocapsa sp. PCC 73106]
MNRKIRDAIPTDLPAIVEIYNASIPGRMATADLEPVSVESRQTWFTMHSPERDRPIWILEIEDKIAGWLSFQSFYGRPAYHQTVELSIYVSPSYQGQGIGQDLLKRAIVHSPQLGITSLLAFIFAHNLPSLKLFAKYDFQQWGYLPGIAQLDGKTRDLVILGRKVES